MSSHRPEIENRRSFRFVVNDETEGELILADNSRFPVRLLDQSAGGFTVLTDGPPPISCGDVVQFQTDHVLSEVRVVHTTEIDLANEDSQDSRSERRFQIGLMRLRDLSVKLDEQDQPSQRVRWRVFRHTFDGSRGAIISGVLAIAVISAAVFSILNSTPSGQRPVGKSSIDPVVATGTSLAKRDTLSDSAESPNGPTVSPPRQSGQLDFRPDELKHLPGALPFSMAAVVRELQLTDAQLESIRHIINDTDQAIARNAENRLLLDASRRKALSLLDAQQRRRWAAMSGAETPSTDRD
jgi:hypothetical protein